MTRHYLNVPFREKDEAKALGARFDWETKRWYVDGNAQLALFERWLPDAASADPADLRAGRDTVAPPSARQQASSTLFAASHLPAMPDTSSQLAPASSSAAVATAAPAGIPLSQLLNGVAAAIRHACGDGVWTIVEIVELQARGHVYLEVSERSEDGRPIARARAMIWQSTAVKIMPAFEKATGVTIGAGIKLLVLAKPTFHIQYGFSLQIDAIDASFTLGYLEARRREIRARLQREGVYERNRQLPAPWDFNSVLVVAPHDGAGLGDFRAEAERLERYGICRFQYVYSRFQGEGAAREIASAITNTLAGGPLPDVLVIIRGGGATGDLAWLDDYDLARTICDLDVPVFTGIGHQRDSTIPDEVAHTAFDTPSKVIGGIEQRIRQRTDEAVAFVQAVFACSDKLLVQNQKAADALYEHIRNGALQQLANARETSRQARDAVSRLSVQKVHAARTAGRDWLVVVREQARMQIHEAARQTPRLLLDIRSRSQTSLDRTRHTVSLDFEAVVGKAQSGRHQAQRASDNALRQTVDLVVASIRMAMHDTQALMREIIGQGPEKTLDRGFAIVRSSTGKVLTESRAAAAQPRLEIQFKDGRLPVKPMQAESAS